MRYFWYAGVVALCVGTVTSGAWGGADNSQIASAGKQVHSAAAAAEAARAEINKIRLTVKAQLEAQPEWAGTLAELRAAMASLAQARREVLATLSKDPEYATLIKNREEAQAALGAASDAQADAARVQKAGDAMIRLSFDLKKREDAALNNDPKYMAAKAKVDQLRAKADQIDSQAADAMKSDPGYEPAMSRLKAAEQQLTAARQQLATAVQADREQRTAKMKAEQQQDAGY